MNNKTILTGLRFCVERDEGIGEGSDYLNKMVSDYSDFKGCSTGGFISGFVDK